LTTVVVPVVALYWTRSRMVPRLSPRLQERQNQVFAVVDEPLRRLEARSPVGSDFSGDPPIE
jgi:hypothetical protein